MKNIKIIFIVIGIIIAVGLCGFFGLQGFQNKAISYEEQIGTAKSGINFAFWIAWIVVIICSVYGFYYLDNRWLE